MLLSAKSNWIRKEQSISNNLNAEGIRKNADQSGDLASAERRGPQDISTVVQRLVTAVETAKTRNKKRAGDVEGNDDKPDHPVTT